MMRHRNTIVGIMLFVAIAGWVTGESVRGAAAPAAQECQYGVSPTRVDLTGAAHSGVIQVTTAPGCAWTATDDSDWITLTSGASGTGPGSISYAVSTLAPSFETPIRQGHIKVRWDTPTLGQNVQVTQSTGPCHASFSSAGGPTSARTFGARGGGGHLWVLAESFMNGPWLVAEAPDWITLTSPPRGVLRRGDGDVFFAVNPNPSSAPREGTLTFCNGTQTMNIHQAGNTPYQGPAIPGDFDGDGLADLSVFRPGTGQWFVLQSHSGYSYANALTYQWGQAGDMPVPGDFDGDARTDLAMYRPRGGGDPIGNWNLRYSSNGFNPATDTSYAVATSVFDPRTVSLLADFNGDGKQDFVVYSPSRGEWNIIFTSIGVPGGAGPLTSMQWGLPGDIPVPADFDGDGKADLAVWRPSEGRWYIRFSSNGYSVPGSASVQWGLPGDVPHPIDFDGDKKTDLVVWRPSEGRWYILYASTGYTQWTSYQWGLPGDVPMANDFDGDGRADLAVWRPSNGTWYLLTSSTLYRYDSARSYQWGLPGDTPIGPLTPVRRSGLNLTLTQGEHLTGPYQGTVTAPNGTANGFRCTLPSSSESVTCPPGDFAEGTTVQLLVTLDNPFPGARPVWRTTGCDAVTATTCTVVIHGEKNVTIEIGCEVFCGQSLEEPLLQAETRRSLVNPLSPSRERVASDPREGPAFAPQAFRRASARVGESKGRSPSDRH